VFLQTIARLLTQRRQTVPDAQITSAVANWGPFGHALSEYRRQQAAAHGVRATAADGGIP
jgi:hypothetical protein